MRAEAVGLGGNRKTVVFRAGHGPPLVWLHGLYGVEADASIVESLASAFSVFAPVAPGFDDLEELHRLHDIHDLALHYDDVLDALDLPVASMAGHSFGAMLAAEYAAHFPRRVSRLVLLSPLGLWNDRYPVADPFGIPPAEVPSVLFADPSLAPRPGADVESVIALARGMASVACFTWPIPDRGLARRLYRVRAPTLVVFGEQDRFVPPAYASDWAALLSNCRCEVVAGAGHMLTVEAAEETLQFVEQFLGHVEALA